MLLIVTTKEPKHFLTDASIGKDGPDFGGMPSNPLFASFHHLPLWTPLAVGVHRMTPTAPAVPLPHAHRTEELPTAAERAHPNGIKVGGFFF